jgi:putative ABC transport system ATP-binding protein/lipoprotein-releasing system ATP-binding protein
MSDPLVLARGICRSFEDGNESRLPVLFDVDCRIDAGDRIAVVGVSGCGKTTLLHILGGLDDPTSGHITWPALGSQETLRPANVAFVFQVPSLFPALTVIDNVALPLVLLDANVDASAKAAELLMNLELSTIANKLPDELSGGQAQRAAMARALATGPRLILADEPTGQLDGATAEHFLNRVMAIIDETGAALVVATHDETVAARLETRWSIVDGRLNDDAESGQDS